MIEELKNLRKITEALNTSGYLIDQAKEWKFALNSVPDLIFIINKKYEIKFVNKTMLERFKDDIDVNNNHCYDLMGFNGKCLTNCFCDDGLDQYIPILGGWFSSHKSKIYDDTGEVLGYIVVLRDITERKIALDRATFEREQFLELFDSIDEIVYISDPETHELLYLNDTAKETFGDYEGEKCYEVLQNRTTPCEFCTNHIILNNERKAYKWTFKNKKTGVEYRCIDKVLELPDGRLVRFEMAIATNKNTKEITVHA